MKRELRMFKYPLFDTQQAAFTDTIELRAPRSLGIQHVAMQDGVVTLWALVDVDSPRTTRRFHLAGTGHVIPSGKEASPEPYYLGTVFDRQFVWHIFELFQ